MKTRTLAATVTALALVASGCAAEFSPVVIYEICAPPTPDSTTGQCTYPSTCDATLAGTPVLDVVTAQLDLRLPIQINHTLTDNSKTSAGGVNTNDAWVQSFEMTYSGATLASRTVVQAVTVPTGGNASTQLDLVPTAYFDALDPGSSATRDIVVNVRAKGNFMSQSAFTTAWFQVPVRVCNGCLSTAVCPAGDTLATCPPSAVGAVSPGQTAAITCLTAQ